MSRHAGVRKQQRVIPQSIVDALLDFGMRRPAGTGIEKCYFDKRAWRHYAAYLGHEARHFERYRSVYVIVAETGSVITTCWTK
jgi:hypothetical protein